MAIIGLFECQVIVNGQPLHEYDDDDEERDHSNERPEEEARSKLSVKHIQAVVAAKFGIKFHVKPGFSFKEADYLHARLILDGQHQGGHVVTRPKYLKTKGLGFSETRFGTRFGNDKEGFRIRKFLFGEIVTGEILASHDVEDLKIKYDQLGSIKIEVWRRSTLSITRGAEEKRSQALEVIPEKLLKGRALTLRSSLGEAERTTVPVKIYNGKKLDDHPIAAFVFKYRSTEALKQLLVIPRTRSPTPLEERSVEDLSVEELRERLRRREAGFEATRARVKKEKAESTLHTLRAMKRFRGDMGIDEDNEVETIAERSAHKKPRPAVEQEVIDLSD